MDKKRKAVVGIVSVKKGKGGRPSGQPSVMLDKMPLNKTIGELLSDPHWKTKLVTQLAEYGHKVHSLSVLRQDNDGYNIVATIVESVASVRGKPVTRG